MNQRIKELITQAGGHWNHGDFNMPSSVEFQEQDIEKFAELIVRQCLSIIERRKRWIDNENGNTDNLWTHGYEKAINRCSMFIKEYLGVYE